MLSKMVSALTLVGRMLGVRSIAPTMIKNVDVEIFVYPVSGVPQKMWGIMQSKFAG